MLGGSYVFVFCCVHSVHASKTPYFACEVREDGWNSKKIRLQSFRSLAAPELESAGSPKDGKILKVLGYPRCSQVGISKSTRQNERDYSVGSTWRVHVVWYRHRGFTWILVISLPFIEVILRWLGDPSWQTAGSFRSGFMEFWWNPLETMTIDFYHSDTLSKVQNLPEAKK